MAFFAVFNNTTGDVVRSGQCPSAYVEDQITAGHGVVELEQPLSSGEFYVEDGEVVAKPARPSLAHDWDHVAKAWSSNLARFKELKWAAMKAVRKAEAEQPIATQWGTFDADEKGRANIAQTVQLMSALESLNQLPQSIDFTRSDNTVATLTPEQMTQVGVALGTQVQAAYNKGRTVRQQIDAAQTYQDVDAIGWPS